MATPTCHHATPWRFFRTDLMITSLISAAIRADNQFVAVVFHRQSRTSQNARTVSLSPVAKLHRQTEVLEKDYWHMLQLG
jgi:hypothetical protein